MNNIDYRTYIKRESAVFWKTTEKYGALSNMARGFPLLINDILIPSSEAFYQALKIPNYPNIQEEIINQNSPILSKRICQEHKDKVRKDWLVINTAIMRWTLRIKLVQNWSKFTKILLSTDDLPIVEYSNKDKYWGAIPLDDNTLHGKNVLGRLLMELREELRKNPNIDDWNLKPPKGIKGLYLLGREILNPPHSNDPTISFLNFNVK